MISDEGDNKKLLDGAQINLSGSENNSNTHVVAGAEAEAAAAKKKKIIKYSLIGGTVAIIVILAIVLIVVLSKSSTNNDGPIGPPPDYPVYNPYELQGTINNEDHVSGVIVTNQTYNGKLHSLALQSMHMVGADIKNHDLSINPQGIPEGENNKFVQNISYYFGVVDYYTGYLKLADANNSRYEVPQVVHDTAQVNPNMRLDMLRFKHLESPFGLEFRDQLDDNHVLLTTQGQTLVFMDKYIQMDFIVSSQRLFGLGEREREFQLTEGVWSMWATERNGGNQYDNGVGGKQGQSVHPFVLVQTSKPGEFVGIYFKNSNAQSPMIRYNNDTTAKLSYITTGGVLEIYFFMHGPAKTIIKQYHNLIGKPTLPPFWSLGWGQASDAYKNLGDYQNMVQSYADNGFPLNVVYMNIHTLANFSNFQINQDDFKDLSKLVFTLRDKGIKVIGLVEGGIGADDQENQYYKMAQEAGILIQSTVNADKFNGSISSSLYGHQQVYLDWLNTETATVWAQGLANYFAQMEFDGLILDKNTPFGDCSGECPGGKKSFLDRRFLGDKLLGDDPYTNWFQSYNDQNKNSTFYLPFISGYKNSGNLDSNTLSLNATHPQFDNVTEYDLHNLFGLMMTETTYAILTSSEQFKENRPFIASKSTFPSSGKYASHFVQSQRSFQAMKHSISSLLNFNMFGIPHTGTDVCGYYGDQFGDEICARWIQLATFYPLARINQQVTPAEGKNGNEPFNLNGDWKQIAKDAMFDRFQYLRFIYSCLFEASQVGGSCYDPLFYEHAQDPNVYLDIDATFLVGGAVKISPILEKGVNATFNSYFPSGRWVNLKDYTEVIDGQGSFELKNRNTVNAHLRPGALIPFQDNTDQSLKSTGDLLNAAVSIVANRDVSRTAVGSLFLDKGQLADEIQQGEYEHYEISVQANTMQKFFKGGKHGSQKQSFDKLVILDAEDLQEVDFACIWDNHFNILPMTTTYDALKKTLTVGLAEPVQFSKFRQISYGSSKKNELNVCKQESFQYQVKDGQQIDLTKQATSFVVTHGAKTLPELLVNLTMTSDNTVNVKWNFANDKDGSPFQVPDEIISTKSGITTTSKLETYVSIINKPYFAIEIKASNGAVVKTIDSMLLGHLLNMYGSTLNTTSGANFHGIMGLGNRAKNDLFYQDGVYSMWSADQGLPYDDGKPPGKNTYSVHPFYMYQNAEDIWVGVFTKLAAAQDWYVKNYQDTGIVETTMIAAGGVVDMFVIVDTTPQEISKSYLNIVGKPILPPFWSLGWHQSRWGYVDTAALQAVVDGYATNKIPLDVMWSDIDYMDTYKDFTIDGARYGNLNEEFVKKLRSKGMKYVPIIDAGISIRDDYQPYTKGVEQDVFLKVRGDPLVGAVWPKEAAFPDWWAENTSSWWSTNLKNFKTKLNFDGIWLDMNEAANFCDGVCNANQQMNSALKRQIQYTPTGRDLEYKGLPLNTQDAKGNYQLDTHSLFGTMEVKATYDYFSNAGVRPFILSRSTFAGMGKYGFNWLGDNYSSADNMGQSVIGAMMMNVFGIPFVGSDICGFGGSTNAELCARWHFVGAFQPFTRNHNVFNGVSQEPYVFQGKDFDYEGVTYTDIMKKAIVVRYHLINYYYTQLFLANQGHGAVYKPLFFEYPNDVNAFANQTNNVMIGDSLKLGVLADKQGVNETEFYFPAGLWCNIFDGTEKCFTTEGETQTRSSKAYDFYLHLREGKIVPMVNAAKYEVMNTAQLATFPVDLHILGRSVTWQEGGWTAQGSYFNDDSSSVNQTDGTFNFYNFHSSGVATDDSNKITIQFNQQNTAQHDPPVFNTNDCLGQIQIYNALAYKAIGTYISSVQFVNGTSTVMGKTTYDTATDRLIFETSKRQLCFWEVSMITLTSST